MDIFEDFEELADQELIDIVEFVNPDRHKYTVRERPDNMDLWNDKEFVIRFRISKDSARQLLAEIQDNLNPRSERNHAVSPLQQLLLTLRFLASGSFYVTIADFCGIHKSTEGIIIQRVINALAELRPQYIQFPQSVEERNTAVIQFSQVARFPRVIGAIDCTHVRLQSPGGPNAENFRSRKGYFSLNVQVICDANLCITDVVARWPGAAHDTHIVNSSAIMMRFASGEMGDQLLLGDSGYPLRSYLLAPIDEPITEAENLYNESHIRTRNLVERTFGIWKRRFPILSLGIRCRLPLAQKVIIASAIIHNIARRNHDELPVEGEEEVAAGNIGLEGHDNEPCRDDVMIMQHAESWLIIFKLYCKLYLPSYLNNIYV